MPGKDILVVEDEADIAAILAHNLEREGFSASVAADGEQALKAVARRIPDLILLDLMLPRMDGLEVCRRLKRDPAHAAIPVIMVTAKGDDADVVVGLELGADDYIVKPFSVKVVCARVRAILRRREEPPAGEGKDIRMRDLVIAPGRHEVMVKGKPVEMTASELRILHLLASRPGMVLTRQQIIDCVRGTDYAVTDRAVDVQIVGIRRKLGALADRLETVRGVGYRFKERQ
ncbi:MAG: response regulator transcription factor [Lentisphaerae bacterium]|nr:response regulator transcription factor [Lentisphaerota bacterium]